MKGRTEGDAKVEKGQDVQAAACAALCPVIVAGLRGTLYRCLTNRNKDQWSSVVERARLLCSPG